MSATGKVVAEFGPSKGNPRNSEGAFITLSNGDIMFIYSKFIGDTGSDDAPACLFRLVSSDGGDTWREEGIVLKSEQDGADNVMSVSLMRMQNGDIGMFYFLRRGFDNGKAYLRRSADEGKTWSEQKVCATPAAGYYVLNNDRVIRLSSGRLVVPAGFHRARTHLTDDMKSFKALDGRSTTVYFYSDDDGESWNESNLLTLPARWTRSGLQEPGAVELAPGFLYGWARTDAYCQYGMFSYDDGASWTEAQPSRFTSPCSPMSIKRQPGSGRLLAVWNPVPRLSCDIAGMPAGGRRTPYVCAVSDDNMKTWSDPLVLENDPASGYCYGALHFVGNDVLLAYCAGSDGDGGCLNRLRMRKLPMPGAQGEMNPLGKELPGIKD